MVLAYIQICHKLWFQQVCIPNLTLLLDQLHKAVFRHWCSSGKLAPSDGCTYFINRFREAHQYCRGGGSAPLQLQRWEGPRGLEAARFVLRSNRSEPGVRPLACWWWCSLFLPCATCRSACSMSWKGNFSGSAVQQKPLGHWEKNNRCSMVYMEHLCFTWVPHVQ